MSINKVIITGNLTRDAELHKTPGGTDVLALGVAVNERKRGKDGKWEDYPNYIDCSLFGNRAAAIAGYLGRGTKVAIEGRLHYNSWDDNGTRRSRITVTVDEIEFMSRRRESAGQDPVLYDGKPVELQEYSDDDIPF